MAQEIERRSEKHLLVIVEDLDKTDLGTSKELFFEYAVTLSEPPVSTIYTFPTPLRHSNEFRQITSTFPNVAILPNLKTQHKDGKPHEQGLQMTEQIITKRLEEGLIDDDALDALAALSIGNFVRLVAGASPGQQAQLREQWQDAGYPPEMLDDLLTQFEASRAPE